MKHRTKERIALAVLATIIVAIPAYIVTLGLLAIDLKGMAP